MHKKELMLGNEAIARGLLENGCEIASSYPGTPASEILSSLAAFRKKESLLGAGKSIHIQWAINEKVAFEIAYAGSMSGLRTAVSMKQVGLNVAADPLMSAAYMGTKGGFLIISADDPGPHSSQTEQDSRMLAMTAKIPVLDPDSPQQAKDMIASAYRLSEAFEIPVMLRPTTAVCHARQDILPGDILSLERQADFQKDPSRWAATPKFRYQLHQKLEEKLSAISGDPKIAPILLNPSAKSSKALVVSGVAAAHTKEIMKALNLWERLPLYQVLCAYPLNAEFISRIISGYTEILVIEEPAGIIEMQIADRHRVKGKISGTVPRVGEILPETVENIVSCFAGLKSERVSLPAAPGRRPTLCAGCPHRASFFAIRKAAPKAIYTGDIGCYTLGLNIGAVDTVLCMGAAISQAAGFYHAYKNREKRPDIVATIGDSTFFHAGIPALIDASVQNVRFVLVILDNRTTAMTGNQPTPAAGRGASGEILTEVPIAPLVRGCGVNFCMECDPYQIDDFTALIKEALEYSREQGPAVLIAKHPCLIDRFRKEEPHLPISVAVNENCDACGYCIKHFECPALVLENNAEQVRIDPNLCAGCGVCLYVCPKGALEMKSEK